MNASNLALDEIGLTPAAVRAHEIKNCVATIAAIAHLLEREVIPAGTARLERMRAATKRLVSLVQSELRPPCVEAESCLVGEAFDEIRARCFDCATQRGIVLRMGGEVGARVPMPLGELASALTNLVKNALEATRAGGRVAVIAMAVPGDRFQIWVSDTGVGMTAKQLASYGKPFRTSKRAGSGLGVAATRDDLARRGASLTVTSKVGSGTRAVIGFERI